MVKNIDDMLVTSGYFSFPIFFIPALNLKEWLTADFSLQGYLPLYTKLAQLLWLFPRWNILCFYYKYVKFALKNRFIHSM